MNSLPKRTIEELVTRYQLEPALQDVFVEGLFDKSLIQSALGDARTARAIYEIDSVDVVSGIIEKYGLSSGNKQRIMALAYELEAVATDARFICLADRDLDEWCQKPNAAVSLRWTKWSALETTFLTETDLRSLLIDAAGCKIEAFPDFFESLTHCVTQLFCLRVADRQMGLCMRWPDFSKLLSSSGSLIHIDFDVFVDRVLQKNNLWARKHELASALSALQEEIITVDRRFRCQGHDLFVILAWSVREYKGHAVMADESAIERAVVLLGRDSREIVEQVLPR